MSRAKHAVMSRHTSCGLLLLEYVRPAPFFSQFRLYTVHSLSFPMVRRQFMAVVIERPQKLLEKNGRKR